MAAAAAPVLNPSGELEPAKGIISSLRSWWKRRGEGGEPGTTTDYGTLGDVVSFSSRRIAARRALETEQRPALFSDPLAFKLAGNALRDARRSSLRDGKTDARVSRIAVRTKWFDEEVERALHGERGTVEVEIVPCSSAAASSSSSEAATSSAVAVRVSIRPRSLPRPWPSQVVCLGCGMDTRPWRLAFPSPSPSPSPSPGTGSSESESDGDGDRHRPTTISWFDVDARCVLRAKARELEEAGAEVPEGAFDLAFEEEEEGGEEGGEERKQREERRRRGRAEKKGSRKKAKFPLKTSSYVAVPADVSKPGALAEALARAGHDKARPTVFVAEGLLMYLGGGGVSTCLSAAAEACPAPRPPRPRPPPPAAPPASSTCPDSPSESCSSSTFLAVTITPSALKAAQERSRRRRAKGVDVAATDLLASWNFGCAAGGLPALCGENGWKKLDSVVSRSDMARRYGPLVGNRGFEYEIADARVQEERGSLFFVARK